MTQTATLAGKDQRITFFNIFTRSKSETFKPANAPSISSSIPQNPLLRWFEKSQYLTVVSFQTLPAEKMLHGGHLIQFKLSAHYYDRFILLRGLLEFSRPKNISISSSASEKTFELRVSADQVHSVRIYLDTILSLLIKEIRFKASLKSVLKFEQSFKEQHSKLYEELRAFA